MPSNERMDFDKVTPKILEESDDVSGFCCGEEEIDDFIQKEALDFQNKRLGVTYLFHYNGELIGFVTLSMADLRRKKMEAEDRLEIGRENYPALQISQLAVFERLQLKGVGTYLCDFCLDRAIKFSERVGCRFLVLNAIRKAIPFYEKYGFKLLKRQEKRREPVMFLNIFSKKQIEYYSNYQNIKEGG